MEKDRMITAEELWPKLDAKGEDEVRQLMALGAYGNHKIPLINEWFAR